ncbi:MAG: aminotransferase class V-fold PLP-dependent enzyme [Oscillospiraceae bacterium]|nr:aminotransferase class V-fold PLP-dependent enzyme [Oscillospiraceae bacterium]
MDKNKVDYSKMTFATRAIKFGEGPDPTTHALNTPIYETTTYAYDTTDEYDQMITDAMNWEPGCCIYSRTTNPTTMAMERKVASLENAEDACVISCGMAAVSLSLLTQLNAGDHVICSDDTFICTASMFEDILPSKGIETDRVEVLDLDALKAAIKPNTKVIYLEALSNPLLKLADIRAIAAIAHEHGCKFIVDNTFLSPFIMRPLDLGADIVVHSGTKYYVGHGDAICGIVAGSKKDMDRIKYYNDNLGTHISPFDSWLALRGVRTLPLRLTKQSQTALALARWLETREEVEFVIYPGLESHKQHELAKTMFNGDNFGGMLCFHLKGGYEEMAKFADNVEIPPIATSLGDVVTLIYPKKPYDNLIRLSVGCEDFEDLKRDFEQAFAKMKE